MPGDGCAEEVSTEECERFDLDHGSLDGFEGIAVSAAKRLQSRGERCVDEGGGGPSQLRITRMRSADEPGGLSSREESASAQVVRQHALMKTGLQV